MLEEEFRFIHRITMFELSFASNAESCSLQVRLLLWSDDFEQVSAWYVLFLMLMLTLTMVFQIQSNKHFDQMTHHLGG